MFWVVPLILSTFAALLWLIGGSDDRRAVQLRSVAFYLLAGGVASLGWMLRGAAILALAFTLNFALLTSALAHGASDYSVWCRYAQIYYDNVGGKFYSRDNRLGYSHISGNDYIYTYEHQVLHVVGPFEWWSTDHQYSCRNYDWKPPLGKYHDFANMFRMFLDRRE